MRKYLAILILLALPALAAGVQRNPPPDFESGHELPTTAQPPTRIQSLEYLDVAVLVAALSAASYLAIRSRSRGKLVVLMVACLAYFGFYRQGCVCPIGAIQNVAMAAFDSSYTIPLTVLAFFVIPLIFTLLWGRMFCAAVCPLGAAQDLVALRPVKVPSWLEQALGTLPFLYLGAAVLLAATGSAFIICQYDPFVAFFRLGGQLEMLILGALVLLIGLFVARPYCRFVCPYGAILRLLSHLSRRHVTVTPDECVHCRLCENACPFEAIEKPTTPLPPRHRLAGKPALMLAMAALPVLTAGLAVAGWHLAGAAAGGNPTFRLAAQVMTAEQNPSALPSNEIKAFRTSGVAVEELYAQAAAIKGRFAVGGAWVGALLGLVLGGKLVSVSVRRRRVDYVPNRGRCVSCGRCFSYCPIEHVRLDKLKGKVRS